jgi:hypothetical protein
MLRDDDAFSRPMDTRVYTATDDEMIVESAYTNDDLDDVFGSGPSSPTFEDGSHSQDDSWHNSRGNAEHSDIPRLKEKHETEGYRDGVTKGKAESVQAGFDEGYGLGAMLGLRIGKILGLLEGICGALRSEEEWKEESGKIEGLWAEAKKELSTGSVFGREWWGEDGIWKFEVEGEGDGKEVTFLDVAGAHPLVRKWEGIVEKEVERWGLDLGIMEGEHEHSDELEDGTAQKIAAVKRETGAKEVAAESVASPAAAKILGIPKKDLSW